MNLWPFIEVEEAEQHSVEHACELLEGGQSLGPPGNRAVEVAHEGENVVALGPFVDDGVTDRVREAREGAGFPQCELCVADPEQPADLFPRIGLLAPAR